MQYNLVQAIEKSTAGAIVLVLMHGGGVAIPSEAASARVGAILDTFYGGPLGPQAIVETLFGDVVPGGRMPITVYDPSEPMEDMTNYDMTAG